MTWIDNFFFKCIQRPMLFSISTVIRPLLSKIDYIYLNNVIDISFFYSYIIFKTILNFELIHTFLTMLAFPAWKTAIVAQTIYAVATSACIRALVWTILTKVSIWTRWKKKIYLTIYLSFSLSIHILIIIKSIHVSIYLSIHVYPQLKYLSLRDISHW